MKMQGFFIRLQIKTRAPVEKKNSVIMLLKFFLYRLKLYMDFGHPYLHFNGCGDFTLVSKEDWDSLGGYLEDPIFSWNVDSLFLIDTYYYGLHEVYLMPPKAIYHIEHSAGSGWTPGKGEQLLFERLEKAGIPYFSWEDCLKYAERWRDAQDKNAFLHIIKNRNYGFVSSPFPEKLIE
jgi:hypothetical protein